MYFAHYRCTKHGFDALMLEDEAGDYCRRLTASKCCGSWNKLVKRWKIDPQEMIDELADFVDLEARP